MKSRAAALATLAVVLAACSTAVQGAATPNSDMPTAVRAELPTTATGDSPTPTSVSSMPTTTTPVEPWSMDPDAAALKDRLDIGMQDVVSLRALATIADPNSDEAPMQVEMRLEGLGGSGDDLLMAMTMPDPEGDYDLIATRTSVYLREVGSATWFGMSEDSDDPEIEAAVTEMKAEMEATTGTLTSAFLLLAEDIQSHGPVQVGQTPAERFTMNLDLQHIGASGLAKVDKVFADTVLGMWILGMKTMPMTIWLDEEDRLAGTEQLLTSFGNEVELTARYLDYDEPQDIELPDPQLVEWL